LQLTITVRDLFGMIAMVDVIEKQAKKYSMNGKYAAWSLGPSEILSSKD